MLAENLYRKALKANILKHNNDALLSKAYREGLLALLLFTAQLKILGTAFAKVYKNAH